MKKTKKIKRADLSLFSFIASFAMFFSVVSANTRCVFLVHELEKPNSLKKLRKF